MKSMLALLVLALSSCAGCPPQPFPTSQDAGRPDWAGPPTIFTAATLDCHDPSATVDRERLLPHIEKCLLNQGTGTCLAGLATMFKVDAVGCAARDRGAVANFNVNADPAASVDEKIMADAARNWIVVERIGFR